VAGSSEERNAGDDSLTTSVRQRLSSKAWWLIALWLLGLVVLFNPWVHGTDPVGYYSWLRSAVIDGNLDTTNEYYFYGKDQDHIIFPGPTGYNENPYAIGSPILWSPFFLTAHAISVILHLPTDGYAPLYQVATGLGSAIYALLGLWLAYRIARELFDARAAIWATIGIWWATPLLFYMYSNPIMSHANDAFVNALFIYVWYRTRSNLSNRNWVWRGAALGLAALVRPQNTLLALLPLAEASAIMLRDRRLELLTWLKRAFLFGLAAVILFAPQLITWQQTYGTLLPGNPYAVYGDKFDFTSPHFFDVLFSTARGLFVWSPLVLFAIVGLIVFAWRVDRTLGIGLILVWLAQVYLIGSWSQWSAAASFGQRFMINGTPLYIIGLAALLFRLRDKVNWKILGGAIGLFVVWNLLLMAQYIVELIPRAGEVDLGQMIGGQFRVIGVVIDRLSSLLAARFGKLR
jgi:hypothetical protein